MSNDLTMIVRRVKGEGCGDMTMRRQKCIESGSLQASRVKFKVLTYYVRLEKRRDRSRVALVLLRLKRRHRTVRQAVRSLAIFRRSAEAAQRKKSWI